MAKEFGIVAAALLALTLSFSTAAQTNGKGVAPAVAWTTLSAEQQQILSPLQKDWATLEPVQQRRLVETAKRFPKMLPIQQERFQDRIKDWAKLTPQQRTAARATYKDLSKLPPAKQHELRERWQERKGLQETSPPPTQGAAALPAPAQPPGAPHN